MLSAKRVVVVAAIVALTCGMAAVAQGPGPGGPPPMEKNPKAWELEAKTVAQSAGLSAELTAKLVEAYQAARESHMEAIRAKMNDKERGRPNMGAMREVTLAERAKFETAVKAFLNPEQTTKAVETLGTFSRRWDPMVTVLDGMKLDDKAKESALKLTADYVAENAKLMQSAAASNDFDAVREKLGALKAKLDADMGKVLNAEQMTQWTAATSMRRGPGGGMGGGMGGQGRGPRGGDTPPPPAQ